ncbi:DUF2306 domain-containing protein [Flavobacterium sp. WW92]|uniref:DUF2306 domain-containing protein n=1 Tax=unclassified Flavobacterium TaxID=196869 RepID=UPI0022247A78|nr:MULTISPECIES: DUF2306 domain-containing protein [unclassified Flavobacterium]WDO11770.1 DUF2306 domain-containing protein [Flavobacterium sp. WW92]
MATTKLLKLEKTDLGPLFIWVLIIFLTWLFMHGADHFLLLTPEALGKYFKLKWVLIAHITAGGGALVLGFVQFWPKLRNFSWKLHRIIGFLYLLAILLSSSCAVILAFTTAYEVNWAYAFSLQVWVSVWISATAIAYYAIIKRNVNLHKEWMVRSYIVTLAFIISGLAIKIPYVQNLGSFADISPSFFWMGWSVPLYVYQIVLSSKKKK